MTAQTLVFYTAAGPDAGRIVSVFKADPESAKAHVDRRGLPSLVLGDDDPKGAPTLLNRHFVDLSAAPVLAACRELPVEWSPEAALFSGLPPGSMVRLLGDAHQVDDGGADLSDLPPGDYAVTISAAGFLTQTYRVTR